MNEHRHLLLESTDKYIDFLWRNVVNDTLNISLSLNAYVEI